MAEILISLKSTTSGDAARDARTCLKPGHPICAMPDGHKWGRKEGLPNFFVLVLPGVDVSTVKRFVGADLVPAGADPIKNPSVQTLASRFSLDLNTLTPEEATEIQDTGRLVVQSLGARMKEQRTKVLDTTGFSLEAAKRRVR